MKKFLTLSTPCILVILQLGCASPIPGSGRISDFQLERHAEKIAWMKACETVVINHEQGKCLADYFSGEVIYQENKISQLDEIQRNTVITRSNFLAKEYETQTGALQQCVAAHSMGVGLMNAVDELVAKETSEKLENPPLVDCIPRQEQNGVILGGKKS